MQPPHFVNYFSTKKIISKIWYTFIDNCSNKINLVADSPSFYQVKCKTLVSLNIIVRRSRTYNFKVSSMQMPVSM